VRHSKPKKSSTYFVAVAMATLLVVSHAAFVEPIDDAKSATYASGALVFNPRTDCQSEPLEGFLSLDPGVQPAAGNLFTLQAVIRSPNVSAMHAMIPLSAGTSTSKALTVSSKSNRTWAVDMSGHSSIFFELPNSATMATNTWFQLTVVGDSQGVAMWLDGTRLISSVPAGNSVITDMSQKVDQGNNQVLLSSTYVNEDATTAPVYRHTADFIAASNQVGAWKDAGWCGLGFDMSNVRFTDRALFSSLDSTVAFPSVPLQVVDGTSLLINTTTPALSLNSSDSSNRQSLTNWGFRTSRWVSATTDREAPVIEVTSAPVQTVAPGEPVSCEVSSTGGAITSYSVDPSPGAGMSFSSTSGVLRGAPTSSGSTTYTITGFNNSGSVSSSCTITVSTSSSSGESGGSGSGESGGSGLAVNLPQPKSLTSTVYFAPNSAQLDKASKRTLRELVLKLKNAKASSIRIDGHADQIVGLIPNSKLATDRAKVVAKYLRARVANSTFLVRAFSAKRPAILGESIKAYSMNRRAGLSVSFWD